MGQETSFKNCAGIRKEWEEPLMLDEKGFDLWADGYAKSVGASDEEGSYPFAGYKQILNEIYNRVLAQKGKTVLDVGLGTGILTRKLYERGCQIWGQDFSERMIELAGEKMPGAKLYQGDFSEGLAEELKRNRYDAIIATYSLHHLTDGQKVGLLKTFLSLLKEDGCIYIGDVAFETRPELENQRSLAGDEWDEEEIYFVADELREVFPKVKFQQFSFCAGLLTLGKDKVSLWDK